MYPYRLEYENERTMDVTRELERVRMRREHGRARRSKGRRSVTLEGLLAVLLRPFGH